MKRIIFIACVCVLVGWVVASASGVLKTPAQIMQVMMSDPTNGTSASIDTTGALLTSNFYAEVAKGNVPGHTMVNKFGNNDEITTGTDPEDVFSGGGIYGFFPTEAVDCDIKSADADDDGDPVGTGARTVLIYGLDSNWDVQSETVTLNGTTEVPLTKTYIRIYRAIVMTAGSSGTNEGALTIASSEAAGGIADNTVGAYIAALDGQTQQCIYTIPNNKTGYFVKGYVAISKGGGSTVYEAEFKWKMRLNNGTTGAWTTKGQVSCITHGGSSWQYEYGIPVGPIPEKTDIKIDVPVVTGTVGVVGGYDILLVDDGY